MTSIEIIFLTGRYHATPWGRHVNEGLSEWPPSPWRILRALVASWYRIGHPQQDVLECLLRKLASVPEFSLPPATQGNSQHYLPGPRAPLVKKTKLTFDTFVLMERGARVAVVWRDAVLSQEEAELLDQLLSQITYLGRAESWVDVHRTKALPSTDCFPADTEGDACGRVRSAQADVEMVRILCATENGDILSDLQYDTRTGRSGGWLDPPGSRWIDYFRPRDAFSVQYRPDFSRDTRRAEVVRFALYAKPLPSLTEAVRWGELARLAVMSRYGKQNNGEPSCVLAGKDETGAPLSDHQHAHYLATDEDSDGRLDHLTVYAPMGFSREELGAITSVRELNPGNGKQTVGLAYLGASDAAAAGALPFRASRAWVSMTPFVPGRFPKYTRAGEPKRRDDGTQIDSPLDQVRREWERRRQRDPSLPSLVSAEPVSRCILKGTSTSWAAFRIWRSRGKRTDTPGIAVGYKLRFSDPVRGPVVMGYGSHFGLGLFLPVYE